MTLTLLHVMWHRISHFTLFDVRNDVHSCMYNLHNKHFLLLHLNKPKLLLLCGIDSNFADVRYRKIFFGCFKAKTVLVSLNFALMFSSRDSCNNFSDSFEMLDES